MTFNQLEIFIALVETGSFSAAAETLYVSQSTLSKQIKVLEKELDTRLLTRKATGVELTSSGMLFLSFAQSVTKELHSLKSAISPYTTLSKKQITICSEPGMTPYGILDIIDDYQREENPGIVINFREHGFEELYAMLDRREADMAIIWEENADARGYDAMRILADESVAIMSAKHPLAHKGHVDISELSCESFSVHQRCAVGKCTASLCEAADFTPIVAYLVSRTSSQIDLAEMGKAVSFVMGERAYSWNNPSVAILRLNNPLIAHVLAVIPKEDASPEARKFRRYLAYKLNERTYITAKPV